MSGTVRWSREAIDDIRNIFDYIAADSPYYAALFTGQLVAVVEYLRDFPQIGRAVPEFDNPSIREILFKDYRIIYRTLSENVVEIATVVHGSKLL